MAKQTNSQIVGYVVLLDGIALTLDSANNTLGIPHARSAVASFRSHGEARSAINRTISLRATLTQFNSRWVTPGAYSVRRLEAPLTSEGAE